MRVPELPPSITSTYSGPGLQSNTVQTAAVTCSHYISALLSLVCLARAERLHDAALLLLHNRAVWQALWHGKPRSHSFLLYTG